MDGRRFDALTRRLGQGASRRSLIKGFLGLGSAMVAGSQLEAEAARRPTPTPKPVSCPGSQTWNGSACVCPPGTTKCGPDCCPNGQAECCDNACCYGTCYGEELCCPSSREFCPTSGECCPDGGACVDGVCCYGDQLCNDGTVCCSAGTTCAPTELFIGGVQQELCCASGKACSDDDPKAVCCDSPSSTCYRFGCCDSGVICTGDPGNPVCCSAGQICDQTNTACVNA